MRKKIIKKLKDYANVMAETMGRDANKMYKQLKQVHHKTKRKK